MPNSTAILLRDTSLCTIVPVNQTACTPLTPSTRIKHSLDRIFYLSGLDEVDAWKMEIADGNCAETE
jgi:hypothetical protein